MYGIVGLLSMTTKNSHAAMHWKVYVQFGRREISSVGFDFGWGTGLSIAEVCYQHASRAYAETESEMGCMLPC